MTTSGSASPSPLDARGLPVGYAFKPEWEITPRDLKSLRDTDAKFILLDCRRPDEHQVCRIEGSTLIPLADIERRADDLEDDAGGKTTPIIVHCHHGMRSLRATATLRALGFSDVRSLAGGIDLWSIDVDPSVPRY